MKKLFTLALLLVTISCAKNKEFVNNTNSELPEWINAELLKAELEGAKLKIAKPTENQEAIEKMHFDSGKFGS